MSRWGATRAARWGAQQDERDQVEAARRASLQSNPHQVVENILSRALVCAEVERRLVSHPGDTPAAIEFVATRWGIPVETVQECISVEALETGK